MALDQLVGKLAERQVADAAPSGWSLGGDAAPTAPQPRAPVDLGVGDDVIHASFGEGIVTAVEPGSVVVVRFAGDGAER